MTEFPEEQFVSLKVLKHFYGRLQVAPSGQREDVACWLTSAARIAGFLQGWRMEFADENIGLEGVVYIGAALWRARRAWGRSLILGLSAASWNVLRRIFFVSRMNVL